jgi:hypothetical protein
VAAAASKGLFLFINKGTKKKKHLILLLLLLLLLRDRDLCYSRAFQKSCLSVEELGAAVLNPWEKKERKEFSGSKVVCRSESLGEERKEFSSSKGCRFEGSSNWTRISSGSWSPWRKDWVQGYLVQQDLVVLLATDRSSSQQYCSSSQS